MLYGYIITFYLSIHLVVDIWVFFTCWLLQTMNNAPVNICVQVFCCHFCLYLGVELPSHMATLTF